MIGKNLSRASSKQSVGFDPGDKLCTYMFAMSMPFSTLTTALQRKSLQSRQGDRGAPVPVKAALSLGIVSLRLGQLPFRWGTLVAAISSSESGAPSARKLVSTCTLSFLGVWLLVGVATTAPTMVPD